MLGVGGGAAVGAMAMGGLMGLGVVAVGAGAGGLLVAGADRVAAMLTPLQGLEDMNPFAGMEE
jgi:hypothetical protein